MLTTETIEPRMRTWTGAERAALRSQTWRRLMADAPFQPATNWWRAIELPELAAALPATGRGLDLGCGDGVLTGLLAELVGADWALVGVDLDPAEVATAGTSGLYRTAVVADGSRLPLADHSFDFAFANSVLEHIPPLSETLAEAARCLKTGGLFAATVPSPHLHGCLRGPLRGGAEARERYLRELDRRVRHVHYWSADRWAVELGAVGLEPAPIRWYLSREDCRRWELWSNLTGGLLYRLQGGRRPPIEIQRSLGLRRGLPRPLRAAGAAMAGLFEPKPVDRPDDGPEAHGCFLVLATKAG